VLRPLHIAIGVLCLIAVAIPFLARERHFVISDNGNIIFYNSPAAVTLGDQSVAIGYLTNTGEVRVQTIKNGSNVQLDVVHDYAQEVKPVQGKTTDDHAAPALYFDARTGSIYLATAFHNSDLYIYKRISAKKPWELYRKIAGKFTYPRFVETPNGAGFFIRELVRSESNERLGNLIFFDLKDLAPRLIRKAIVPPDKKRATVYASVPYVYGGKAYFVFTMHYGEDQYVGVHIGISDLSNWSWEEFDISTPFSRVSTRPTGIWSDGESVKIGVSNAGAINPSADDLIVLQVELKTRTEKELTHVKNIETMFYSNSATFNAAGEVLISGPDYQYPQYVTGSLGTLFVRNNRKNYSIRDFDTSLVLALPSYLAMAQDWLVGRR
jgi:BNR repeat-containing family member